MDLSRTSLAVSWTCRSQHPETFHSSLTTHG